MARDGAVGTAASQSDGAARDFILQLLELLFDFAWLDLLPNLIFLGCVLGLNLLVGAALWNYSSTMLGASTSDDRQTFWLHQI